MPEMRNKIPISNLNSTRTKEGEPGEPANPKVETIMAMDLRERDERSLYGVDHSVDAFDVHLLNTVRISIPRDSDFIIA